jgi:ABC-type branched-subunit amino acid transport system substrate-binding protein
MPRLPWHMSQEEFNQHLQKLTPQREKTLRRVLAGKSYQEIAEENAKKKPDQEIFKNKTLQDETVTVRSHISSVYNTFEFPPDSRNINELIRLFCKFRRGWVAHRLRDQHDCLRVDDYLDVNNIRSDDSNFRLKEGIEALYQEDYQRAIRIFEKEIAHDPTHPIPKILLNNAKAYQPKDRPRPFRIAVVVSYAPQNNSHVDATENVLRGVADAQTQFNESGGKNERYLEIIIADDRNQPKLSQKQAYNLSDIETILAVIGHHSSEGTKAALQIYGERIAVISPTSTSSSLKSKTFFRTIDSTKAVARKYVEYVDHLKIEKIAIFYHEGNEYSKTLKDDFQEALKIQDSGTAVKHGSERAIEPIDMRKSLLDIEREIAQIRRKGCQAILIISSIETNKIALDIIRTNSRYNSQKLKLMLSTSFPERLILKRMLAGEDFSEGVAFVRPDLTEESHYIEQARKTWQQAEIDWRVGTSYAAIQALIEAIKLSKETTREEILRNLKVIARSDSQASRFGLSGSVDGSSDTQSSTLRKYRIAHIRDGKFENVL